MPNCSQWNKALLEIINRQNWPEFSRPVWAPVSRLVSQAGESNMQMSYHKHTILLKSHTVCLYVCEPRLFTLLLFSTSIKNFISSVLVRTIIALFVTPVSCLSSKQNKKRSLWKWVKVAHCFFICHLLTAGTGFFASNSPMFNQIHLLFVWGLYENDQCWQYDGGGLWGQLEEPLLA